MSSTAIKIENISKKYDLFHKKSENGSLVGAFAGGIKSLFTPGSSGQSHEDFWALKDISFEVSKGDRVGIIGRNGAGKSTLLKVMSRIVKPTTGRIEFEGRMASLLEVGTGFHGDLTGRENIYLNGSILGMSKREIDARFDEIVAFSEVERFLDTPVKRYSSGMYVRLAFSVAAHLEPDILIVDEVLAVGDAAFQKKCIGKMEDVSKNEGRTILFVSHQMGVLSALCNQSVLLEKGRVKEIGATDKIINAYMQSGRQDIGETKDDSPGAPGEKLKIRSVRVLNHLRQTAAEINNLHTAFLEIGFEILERGRGYDVSIELKHIQYGTIFTSCLKDANTEKNSDMVWDKGLYKFIVELPVSILRGGEYLISAGAAIPKVEVLDLYGYDTAFSILDSVSPVAKTMEGRNGAILPVLEWKRS